MTAAALLEMLKPNYAWAIQVQKDDNRIKAASATAASPQGNGGEISARAFPGTARAAQPASGLLEVWLRLLGRAQPITNALARASRPLIEPIEGRGWGDELLVYAQRRA